jgi:chemotaxis protein MotB
MWWPFRSVRKSNRRIPRHPRRPSPVLAVHRRPSYHRPSAPLQNLASDRQAETAWGNGLRLWSLSPQWLALSAVAHILLLGVLATILFPVSQRSQQSIPLHFSQAQTGLPSIVSPVSLEHREAQAPPDANLTALRQFQTAATERTNQLERKFVELAQTLTAKAETIARQQQQLETAQHESARLAEELAARTAAEQEAATRLAEEQTYRAKLEAEIAEQHSRYEAALQGTQEAYRTLLADLQGEIARKDITIREFADRLAINITDRVLFPSGQTTLTTEGKNVLGTIGQVLAKVTDRRIQIEGHTDAQEIGPELKKFFASNWELSAARATEVVRYLLAHTSLPAEHLLAVGRADTVPVASNATEAGRRLNRRIEILLLPIAKPLQAEHNSTERPG